MTQFNLENSQVTLFNPRNLQVTQFNPRNSQVTLFNPRNSQATLFNAGNTGKGDITKTSANDEKGCNYHLSTGVSESAA